MTSNPTSTNLRGCIEATARAFLSAYEEGGVQNDASVISHNVTADCRRYLLPSSVPRAFGQPPDFFFDTTTYQEKFAKDIKVMKFKNNIISNLIIDTETRRASFTSVADVHVIKTDEVYQAEFAWFLYFNEDGSKVNKVVGFGDKELILKMASAAA